MTADSDAGGVSGRSAGRVTVSASAQWPLLIVLAAVAAGLIVALLWQWRIGAGIIGGAVGVAAIERLLLPDRVAGLLHVRSKAFDVAVLAVLSIGIVVSAVVVPDAPGQ